MVPAASCSVNYFAGTGLAGGKRLAFVRQDKGGGALHLFVVDCIFLHCAFMLRILVTPTFHLLLQAPNRSLIVSLTNPNSILLAFPSISCLRAKHSGLLPSQVRASSPTSQAW